jgi:hypothetical protein
VISEYPRVARSDHGMHISRTYVNLPIAKKGI